VQEGEIMLEAFEFRECRDGIGTETISKLWKFDKHMQLKVVVLLWRWWSARNKVNNGERL
jgi:hypothetical protein